EDVQLAESLWSELQESGKERIKDLCRNPLRLTLLCATWKGRGGKLPDTTAKLYEKFVNYIYQWKKKEFPIRSKERKRLNAALGELGKVSLDGERRRFRLSHRLVCEYLGEPDEDSLLDTALKLGWLNKLGGDADEPEDPIYAFYHATFQEYFAALAVADWDYFLPKDHCDRPVEGKRYRIFEPQWKQVILLWLGREDVKDEEKEGFIRGLVEFKDGCGEWNFKKVDRGFYEHQAYFLAAAGINEFKACSLATEIVQQLVKWGFGYFDINEKKWISFLSSIFNYEIQVLNSPGILKVFPFSRQRKARNILTKTCIDLAASEIIKVIESCSNIDIRNDAKEILLDAKGKKIIITQREDIVNNIYFQKPEEFKNCYFRIQMYDSDLDIIQLFKKYNIKITRLKISFETPITTMFSGEIINNQEVKNNIKKAIEEVLEEVLKIEKHTTMTLLICFTK
ncbi:NACHT domain-containing protein, partial [Limnospira sp. PMC 737.11]|uniref:NACHT domain-containing protein n=1 Tax=Limnospira sp. PMC 737.11 TaxID=2981095 RepID=UPI0037BE4196